MPYIRFSRDRHGYEHTYVLHAARRNGKKRARLLYWFRTPPNVKVGRAPLDEDAIRAIEAHHPQLSFDWTHMLEARPLPPPAAEPARSTRRKRVREKGSGAGRPRAASASPEPAAALVPEPSAAEPSREATTPVVEPATLDETDAAAAAAETLPAEAASPLPESARPVPAEELVGAEGLARLRTRYAEVQARITERAGAGGDPARTDQLRREAERLNPDGWVTLEEARRGLEEFEATFDGLRRALGRRRRSRRGGARRSRRRRALAEAKAREAGGSTEHGSAAPEVITTEDASSGERFGDEDDDDGAEPDESD